MGITAVIFIHIPVTEASYMVKPQHNGSEKNTPLLVIESVKSCGKENECEKTEGLEMTIPFSVIWINNHGTIEMLVITLVIYQIPLLDFNKLKWLPNKKLNIVWDTLWILNTFIIYMY